ncbi:MAG: ribonuclease, partial [Solirubrobacteraceae bacterium]|nr:ribonuclease [Solirubrobacteraceae bacterium]
MADPISVAATALPSSADVARAEDFTRERFLHEGEDPAIALAPGTPRRRALDGALAELAEARTQPTRAWRQEFSLLLGLERVLSDDEPKLVDGTVLSAHQVDALSGTLTALLAEAQRSSANGNGNGKAAVDVLAAASILGIEDDEDDGLDDADVVAPEPDEDDEDDEDEDDGFAPSAAGEDEDDEDEDEDDDVAAELEAELDRAELEAPPDDWDDEDEQSQDGDEQLPEQEDDPNAAKRFWFEHATGAGKTVAALGFVEASRTGGVLILTHRRNLVDQFHGELKDRGYKNRICPALLGDEDRGDGPVTVETYQWFVRNAGNISGAYTIVICDEAHTALGEKTSAAIRAWTGPIFVGMTATGALIARHVTDLFPTQTSRFDLAQAARRGVISPLRCVRIPPGPGVRTIAKVPLRRGEVDTEFDQEMLAELLDQTPFNVAMASLYKVRFNGVPGVVYAAGVRHAFNLAEAFRAEGLKAMAVSGETKKRELASILARYERGEIDVLINAQLLAEGWNSPRATVCIHLAPTASKRIYQQRVGRVTRRHPGKEAGLVVDFVHPATKNDDPVVTLHSLLDRDVYRGGAIVVGPVRRGRGRRVRVERRVLPVCADPDRRAEVFERELWRIAVEHLDYGEQHVWAALAGARVQPHGWRRARAMLHFDRTGELRRRFLSTAVQRNQNPQLRLKALAEIAAIRDAEAFDTAIDMIGGWTREERREGSKIMLQAMVDKRIGRRDQANAWIWRMAEYTREVHEEYAVQRWPETKRLLGLLVNSSGAAHARNARRLVQAARKQDRRLAAALLASAVAHSPEAEEVLRGARTRMARKPPALARELLRNFPKRRGRGKRRRRRGAGNEVEAPANPTNGAATTTTATRPDEPQPGQREEPRRPPVAAATVTAPPRNGGSPTPPLAPNPSPPDAGEPVVAAMAGGHGASAAPPAAPGAGRRPSRRRRAAAAQAPDGRAPAGHNGGDPVDPESASQGATPGGDTPPEPAPRRRTPAAAAAVEASEPTTAAKPTRVRRAAAPPQARDEPAQKPTRARRAAAPGARTDEPTPDEEPVPRRRVTVSSVGADD